MTQSSIPTAILAGEPLGRARHVCALVRSGEVVVDTIAALADEGLGLGDRVVSIVSSADRPVLVEALVDRGIDVDESELGERLIVTTWGETYVASGAFDRVATLGILRAWLEDRRRPGAIPTRILADMAWTLDSPIGFELLGPYESSVDDYLRRVPSVTVCVYDLERHDAGTIAEVLRYHPLTLMGGSLRRSSGTDEPIAARDRILAAASDLFSQSGVTSTGVDLLIRNAGVAKATFYRHFRSKDELVVAWLEDPRTRWFDRIRIEVERSEAAPIDRIPLLFDLVASWLEMDGFRGCPYLNTAVELTDPAQPAWIVIRRHLDEIEAYLRKMCEEAGLARAAAIAARLQALLAGSISLAVARRTSAFAVSAREAAVQIVAASERS